jgi:hypothetical protein
MKYFKTYELVDEGTYKASGESSLSFFNPELLIALDDLREFFNVPITINNWHAGGQFQWRGLRTPAKAKELGSPFSEHAFYEGHLGNAIDCDIAGMVAKDARQKILEAKNHPLCIRIMRMEDLVDWLHFDLKPVDNRIHLFKA